MSAIMSGLRGDGLERSCDRIHFGAAAPGIERADVHLRERAFEPHRHDTYALGITTHGVQTFRYRGARRVALPGQVHVLHPDETHDGAAGTDAGFGYRIVYVAPELVRVALGDGELPFVSDPVHDAGPAAAHLATALRDIDEPLDELAAAEITTAVADVLMSLSGRSPANARIDRRAVEAARECLAGELVSAARLERVTGLDRFELARQFRRAFGTSPDRYRTMRRLALARHAIEHGEPLARAAAEAGFADQSHMTRQFKRAYGMTPGQWARMASS
jgi:AraC-like DNA-binding protein